MQIAAGRRLGNGDRADLLCGLIKRGKFNEVAGERLLRTAQQNIAAAAANGDVTALMQAAAAMLC